MKKIILASVIALSLLLAAVPVTALAKSDTGSAYSDISGKWFTDAVMKYGYTEIFADGGSIFNPNKKITRMAFVRLLHKALGITINYFAAPEVSKDFDDMKNSDIGAYALIDLTATGIIERGGSFNPDKQLDRDMMIHWIMNALTYKSEGRYEIPMVKPVPFKDDNKISDTYRSEIYSSVVLKLVYGRGNNMLFPKDGATRAEAATIVSRLVSLLDSIKSGVDVTSAAWLVKSGALNMSLTVTNNTDKTITISHTSGQKYDFKLFDEKGNNLYTWSADKMFIALMNTTELKPGENLVFSDTLDSAAYSAVNSAVSMCAYIVGTSDAFTIDDNGYTAAIMK